MRRILHTIIFLLCSYCTIGQAPVYRTAVGGAIFEFHYSGPTVIAVDMNCEGILEWGHPNTPTVEYIGPGELIFFDIVSISGGYNIGDYVPGGTSVTVTYRAEDNLGNSAQFSFTIDFIDTTSPIIDSLLTPPDIVVTCLNQVPGADDVVVIDNCDPTGNSVVVTITGQAPKDTCLYQNYTRTIMATDSSGNTTTMMQNVIVLPDTIAPVIINHPQNESGPCELISFQYPQWLDDELALFLAQDAGCNDIIYYYEAPTLSELGDTCGVIQATFVAEDLCGNRAEEIATFTIIDTEAPVIAAPAQDLLVDCSLDNAHSLIQSWLDNHGGAEMDDNCSDITWSYSPDTIDLIAACNSPIIIDFIATDDCGNSTTSSASLEIRDTSAPVILQLDSIVVAQCEDSTTLLRFEEFLQSGSGMEISDYCTPMSALNYEFIHDGDTLVLNDMLQIFQMSLQSGCRDTTINDSTYTQVLGVISFTTIVSDACGNKVTSDTIIYLLRDLEAPVILQSPSDTAFYCTQQDSLIDDFNDWYQGGGGAIVNEYCGNLIVMSNPSYDSLRTLLLNGEYTCGAGIPIQFRYADDCGNIVVDSTTVFLTILDSVPPVVTMPPRDTILHCTVNLDTTLYEWIHNYAFANIEDACSVTEWLYYGYRDSSGIYMQESFNSTIYPHFSPEGCIDSLQVNFIYGDNCDNIDSFAAYFYVIDTTPPRITNFQDSIYVDCSDIPDENNLEIVDACESGVDVEIHDDTLRVGTPMDCSYYNFTIERTYIVSDFCNFKDTLTQYIFVTDNEAPSFIVPDSISVECGEESNLHITGMPSLVTDACNSPVEITHRDSVLSSGCSFSIVRIWTAIDVCNNENTQYQFIHVVDTREPYYIDSPIDSTVSCVQDMETVFNQWVKNQLQKQAGDSCGIYGRFAAIPGTYNSADSTTYPDSLPAWDEDFLCTQVNGDTVGKITIDFVLYDKCFNTLIVTRSLSVLDTMPPVIDNCPGDTTYITGLSCSGAYPIPAIQFKDLCSGQAPDAFLLINNDTTVYTSGIMDTLQLPVGIHNFELIVRDCALNFTSCNWQIKVLDTLAPSLMCGFDSLYLLAPDDCFQNIVLDEYSISDNCSPDSIDKRYTLIKADGDTITGILPLNENVTLGTGTHTLILTVKDASANVTSCSSVIEVRDTVSPVASCKPAFIIVYPDGQPAPIDVTDFNLNSTDNCGIDSMWITPGLFDCSMDGLQVNVTLYVRDKSGIIDSCTTVGQVELAAFYPSYILDLCNPDTLKLYANPPGGDTTQYLYYWQGPRGFTSNLKNPTLTGVDSSYSGTYTVIISGPTGCNIEASININISTLSLPLLNLSADTICVNSTLILQSSNYSGSATYNWYEGLPPNGVLLGTTSVPILDINPLLGNHSYYVIVSNSRCASDPSEIKEVNVVKDPVAQVAQAFINVCEGEEIRLEAVNQGPSYTYHWEGPHGFTSSLRAPVVTDSASQSHAGMYSLRVALGDCVSEEVTVEVLVNTLSDNPAIDGDSIVCVGEEIHLQSSNQDLYDSYTWENSQGQIYTTTNPFLLIQNASSLDSGTWTVVVEDGKCTSLPSEKFKVEVKPLPETMIISPETICETDSVYLKVESDNAVEFIWISPLGDSLRGKEVQFTNQEGQFLLITRTEYGCMKQETFYVDVIPQPTITALSSTAPQCIDSLVDIRFEPTVFPADNGNYNYQWIHGNNILGTDSTLFLQDADIQDTGYYYLVVGTGLCLSDTFAYRLELTRVPQEPAYLSGNFYCESDSVIIRLNEIQGDSVRYTILVDSVKYISERNAINLGILAPGTYEIQARVSRGKCTSEFTELIEITVGIAPEINTITGIQEICAGDTISLVASGINGNFIWYFNDDTLPNTERTLNILNAGTSNSGCYRVRQVNGTCASIVSDSFYVQVNPTPATPIIESIKDGICISIDSTLLEICLNENSVNLNATYQWYHLGTDTAIATYVGDTCQSIADFNAFTDGINSLYLTANIDACYSENSDTIEAIVSIVPDEIADAGLDIYACGGELPALNAEEVEISQGMWQVLTDSTFISSFTDPNAQLTDLKTGKNIFVWTLSYGICSNFSTDTVVVFYDVPPVAENDGYIRPYGTIFNMNVLDNDYLVGGVEITIVKDAENGRTTVGSSSIKYTPFNGFIGEDSLIYRICSVSCPDACSEARVHIQIGDESLCDIPTIFTPNGDGTNDFFTIQCLSSDGYKNNSLKVFNQYGDEVFAASPYRNQWQGTYKDRPLPVGTYYFIMDFGDGSKIKKGFLIIER